MAALAGEKADKEDSADSSCRGFACDMFVVSATGTISVGWPLPHTPSSSSTPDPSPCSLKK